MAAQTSGSTVSLVGQGSFLTKPSLQTVGCTGKKSNTFTTPPDGLCPLCKAKGQSQVLKTYRLNFTQSIFLCSDPQCIYPLGHTPLDNIIANTADLKNLSPRKQEKRNISELSPLSESNVKRSKTDVPLFGQYSFSNAASSIQAESSTSVQVAPPQEYDATPLGISQCASTGNTEVSEQNVQETSGPFSSASVLNSKPSSQLPPPGSNSNASDSSKPFSAGQDRLYEEPLQSEDVEMIDKQCSSDASSKSPNRLSETEGLEGGEDKPEPSSSPQTTKLGNLVSKTCINLNENLGDLESTKLSPDSVPLSECILPTPLEQNQLGAQIKDNLPQEESTTPSSGESAVSGDSVREMESAQPCDFIPKSLRELCESIESHLLQCTDKVQHNTDVLVNGSCAESDQHRDVSTSQDLIEDSQSASFESTVFPVPEQGNESERILNKSVSPHAEASVKENINDDPVKALEPEFSKASHLNEDSCGTTNTSYSSHDIQPTCLSDNGSVDMCEQPCAIASVMKDCSIEELTAAPLKVCHLSASLQLAEGIEEMHIETTPSSRSAEDIHPELALEVSSLNMPGISCMADADDDCNSVSPEEAPLPKGHLSDQGCQHISSETVTPSALVQDILPEGQSPEKPLSHLPSTPCNSQSISTEENNPSVASEEILIPDTPLPVQLDLIYDCQKSACDRITSSDVVLGESSQVDACNTVCLVSKKDNSSTEQEISSLPDNPLLEAIQLTQDSVEPCGMSPSPQKIQPESTNDNSILGITDSSCNTTSAMDDGCHAPASLTDSQMENTTVTPCSQTEGVEEKKAQPLNDTIADVKDIGGANPADSPLSPDAKRTIRKTCFENTILPDLLLDIQPEHRTEEPLSAVPSPKCDADLMMTISADCQPPNKSAQEAEMNKMEITDPDINNDKLPNSMILSNTLSSEDTLNESIESGPFDLSVKDIEQRRSDQLLEARTFENTQRVLQWKNRKSLCWLDCMLSTLVHSRTLGVFVAKNGINKESLILNLFTKYGEATTLCKAVLKKNKAGKPTKAEACLNEVRMHIFDRLKPLLKCELGNYESPVFAFPLLLRLEPDFQKLFEHSFTWIFKCESCGYTYQERCQKTMTTFTKIVQDWRPLNAAHMSPCNKCQATDQRREMHIETLQSMFMLHFVEGLASNDLKTYAFQFGEHWYEIKTVIRYRDQHFSSWMANDDDTWLESDDLKGPFCRRHQKLRMRAEDIHIVIWERSNRKNIQEESSPLNSTLPVSEIKSENQTSMLQAEIIPSDSTRQSQLVTLEAEMGEQTSTEYSPQVALSDPATEHPSHCAPVVDTNYPAPSVAPVYAPVMGDKSNPLAGMDGYADDDVITLTLVEIPFDSTGSATELKPTDTVVTQVKSSPDNQPAPTEMQVDSAKLPEDTDQKQGTLSQAQPPRSTSLASVSAPQLIPEQPCARRRLNNNMPAATSTPTSKTFPAKKSIVDNMMGPLVKNDNLFLNSNYSSTNRKTTSRPWQPATLLKESDFNGTPKKAENFDGFRAKTVNNTSNSDRSSFLISKLLNNSSSFNVPKEKPTLSVKSFLAPAALGQMRPGKNGINCGKMLAKDGGLNAEDKIRKLRLKLLKKLKAKKNELAMLEKMTKLQQNGSCAGESGGVQPGSVNRREHLRGFLQELQDHIDNTDNESISTVSSCTSICSSPGDAEFFAELFSPSPVDNSENGSRFLEMLADGYGISSEPPQQATGFNYPINNTTPQSTSGADSFPNTFNQSSGEESLNLLSSSTMAMMNEDTGYLDSFVDIF